MTTQPSQETVKPEPTQATYELASKLAGPYIATWTTKEIHDERVAKFASLITEHTQRIEAAATQKLEAEKAELQREVVRYNPKRIAMWADNTESMIKFFNNALVQLGVEEADEILLLAEAVNKRVAEITQLRSQLAGMTTLQAFKRMHETDHPLCPVCVSGHWWIPMPTLPDGELSLEPFHGFEHAMAYALTTQPQPVAGQKEGDKS